jgi:hypothetical protein
LCLLQGETPYSGIAGKKVLTAGFTKLRFSGIHNVDAGVGNWLFWAFCYEGKWSHMSIIIAITFSHHPAN